MQEEDRAGEHVRKVREIEEKARKIGRPSHRQAEKEKRDKSRETETERERDMRGDEGARIAHSRRFHLVERIAVPLIRKGREREG